MNQIYENIPAACPSDAKKLAKAPNRISMVSVRFVDPVTYRHSFYKRVSPNGFELCKNKLLTRSFQRLFLFRDVGILSYAFKKSIEVDNDS